MGDEAEVAEIEPELAKLIDATPPWVEDSAQAIEASL